MGFRISSWPLCGNTNVMSDLVSGDLVSGDLVSSLKDYILLFKNKPEIKRQIKTILPLFFTKIF
jgi:hypothetical protein